MPPASLNLTVALRLNTMFLSFFLQISHTNPWGSSVNENLVIIEKTVFFLKTILYNVAYFSFLVLLQKGGVGESPFSVSTM